MRLKIIRLVVFSLLILIILELFYFQAIRGDYFYNLSTNNRIRVVPVEGWRGRVMDREGVILADNRPSYNILVTPQEIADFEELFRYVSSVLGIKETHWRRGIRKRN